jgi:transglutaminase-like putative cysteine protease
VSLEKQIMNEFIKTLSFFLLAVLLLFNGTNLMAETTIDRLVKKIVRQEDSNDIKVYKIEKWVRKNISYNSDEKQFNMHDRWTLPMETLQRRKGDCEDGSALIIALAVASGVPADRLRLYAPIVTAGGMHASVAYQRETDDQWVWVEWTTREANSLGPINNRPTLKESTFFLPEGHYLELTSLNPFNMTWLTDEEWQKRSKKIHEK